MHAKLKKIQLDNNWVHLFVTFWVVCGWPKLLSILLVSCMNAPNVAISVFFFSALLSHGSEHTRRGHMADALIDNLLSDSNV